MKLIEVFAPATVANVGPGFDSFGFAIDGLGDTVRVSPCATPGVHLASVSGDHGKLSRAVLDNTAGKAAWALWQSSGAAAASLGISLDIVKGLPLCSGLGSSAASAVAGAAAAMWFLCERDGRPYDDALVLDAALAGEAVASGDAHADNVAPCLWGGFTIVRPGKPPAVARFVPSLALAVVVVTPKLEISTKAARQALPKEVPLHAAVSNWANAATLVLALTRGDATLIRPALQDVIVEPCRARLIPGFDEAKAAALAAGAYGCSISGSGPTLFALAANAAFARAAGDAMAQVFADRHIGASITVSAIAERGVRRV
jgi:homoserine kinase